MSTMTALPDALRGAMRRTRLQLVAIGTACGIVARRRGLHVWRFRRERSGRFAESAHFSIFMIAPEPLVQ
jgi:hypothetical protein